LVIEYIGEELAPPVAVKNTLIDDTASGASIMTGINFRTAESFKNAFARLTHPISKSEEISFR
jgi:hypothetical protein